MHVIIVLSLCLLICTTVSDGSSLIYKELLLRTDQLCPDLEELNRANNADSATYPNQSVFHLVDPISSESDPCIFESDGPTKEQFSTLLIRAIHVDYNQWDYSGSQPCTEHIKMQLPNKLVYDDFPLPRPLCGVRKPSDHLQDSHGPLYHPYVWEVSKGKMGISYSILTGSKTNESFLNIDDGSDNPLPLPKDFPANRVPQDQFLQLIFAVFFGEGCSLHVQQYLIDPGKDHCNSSSARFHTVCGIYNCSEEETILRQVGFWNEGLRREQIVKLMEFINTKRNRGKSEFRDLIVGVIQFFIMPIIVFVVAYCFSKRLKEMFESKDRSREEVVEEEEEVVVENTAES